MKEVQADLFGGPQSAIDLDKFTHRGRGLQAAMAMHEIPVHLAPNAIESNLWGQG